MNPSLIRAPRRAAAAATSALVLLAVAGCGSDGAASSSDEGLARFVPAGAPFYGEATVRPSGDLQADLKTITEKVAPGKDVGKLLAGLVGKASDGKLTYERDVEPWLGEKAAVAVTALPATQGGTPDVAAIIDTKDADKAEDALGKVLEGKVADRSYKDVDYRVGKDDSAGGIVEDELVVGTEASFKAIVDASKGSGLDSVPAFTKHRDAVADGQVAWFYGDIRKAFELARTSAAAGGADAEQLEAVRSLLDRQGLSTIAVALGVTDDAIRVRSAAATKTDPGTGAADVVAALPAGSFAALGLGDLGRQLTQGLDALRSLPASAGNVQDGLDQLEKSAGIDVQKDLLDWMGQSGLFVSGSSLTDIGGALVVKSKDPAATKAALAKAKTLVAGGGLAPKSLSGNGIDDGFSVSPAGAPVEVFAAQAGDRFVLAVNRAALDAALSPTTKLADDESFKTAAATLGDGLRPSFFLDFRKVSGLIGLAAGGQPGYAQIRPYLDAITTLVAGSKKDGDLARSTLAIGVR